MKLINLKDQACHDSGDIPFHKTYNMPIILAVLLLEKVKKNYACFLKIMPKLMLAQSIIAYFQASDAHVVRRDPGVLKGAEVHPRDPKTLL